MADNPGSFAPRITFESLLERIEARTGWGPRLTPMLDEARLHARLSVPPLQTFRAFAAVAAYKALAEDSPPPPEAQNLPLEAQNLPLEPQDLPLEAHFTRIRDALCAARCAEELRRLRKTCALLVHPDRLPASKRASAECFMAEINAAIDRAIREKSVR